MLHLSTLHLSDPFHLLSQSWEMEYIIIVSLFSLTSNPNYSLSCAVSFAPTPKQVSLVSLFLDAPTVQLSMSSFLPSDYHSKYIHSLPPSNNTFTTPSLYSHQFSLLFTSSYTHLFVFQSLFTCLLSNSLHVVSVYLQKWLIPVSLASQSSPVSKIHSLYQALCPTHLFFVVVVPSNCLPE